MRCAKLRGVGVPHGRPRLELVKSSGLAFEEHVTRARDLERQQGIRPTQIDEIEAIGAELRRQHPIPHIQIGRVPTLNADVEITPSPRPTLRPRAEEDHQVEIPADGEGRKTLAKERLRGDCRRGACRPHVTMVAQDRMIASMVATS